MIGLKTKLLSRLSSPFYQNIMNLSVGTAISQVTILLSSPILSRIYSPSDFGLQGLIISFTGFFAITASLGLEVSIVSSENDEIANRILIICMILNIIVAVIGGFALNFIISKNIFSYGVLPNWSIVPSVIIIWATSMFMALRYWAVRRNYFNGLGKSLISQGIGRSIIPLLFGVFSNNWGGLLLGEIFSRLLGIQNIIKLAYKDLMHTLNTSIPKNYLEAITSNCKYIYLGMPSTMINMLYLLLPIPFLTAVYGTEISGQFLFVQNILAIPSSLLSASVGDAFHSRLSAIKNNNTGNPHDGYEFLTRTVKELTWISIIIYVPIALVSPYLFGLIFGSNWRSAGILMSYIAMLSMFAFVVTPVSRSIVVYKKQEYKLVVDLFRLLIPFISIYGVKAIGYDIMTTIIVYVGLGIIGYLFYLYIIKLSCSSKNDTEKI